MNEPTSPPANRRGKKTTGQALSSSQRSKQRELALLAAGGRCLNRVRLSPEAVQALTKLTETLGSERAAIEYSLIITAQKNMPHHS